MNAAGILNVNVDGREVAITCIHVGVNLPRVQQALNAPQFEIEVNKWRRRFPNKTIVGGWFIQQKTIFVIFHIFFHFLLHLFLFSSTSVFIFFHICFHFLLHLFFFSHISIFFLTFPYFVVTVNDHINPITTSSLFITIVFIFFDVINSCVLHIFG